MAELQAIAESLIKGQAPAVKQMVEKALNINDIKWGILTKPDIEKSQRNGELLGIFPFLGHS